MAQRKSGHVTLQDVARACECSVSTVSLVVSEAPLSRSIAAGTRERIRVAAERLGYHPNAFARSLRQRSTQTVGVLAYDLSDQFCIPILRGIHSTLNAAQYPSMVMDAQTDRQLFDACLHRLLERRVEGVLVLASWVFEESTLLSDMRKNRVPIVILGRDVAAKGISSVLVDNELGGTLAMEHLLALGHRRVAVIRGPKGMADSQPRWRGIQRAAKKAGVELVPELVHQLPALVDSASGFEEGCRLTADLLRQRLQFSAVLAFDDLTAMGALRALHESGRRVPEDCSVMGFDDVLPARLVTPALSTVRQPLGEMGRRAAEQVLQAMQQTGAARDEAAVLVKAVPELVVRQSTGPPSVSQEQRRQRAAKGPQIYEFR